MREAKSRDPCRAEPSHTVTLAYPIDQRTLARGARIVLPPLVASMDIWRSPRRMAAALLIGFMLVSAVFPSGWNAKSRPHSRSARPHARRRQIRLAANPRRRHQAPRQRRHHPASGRSNALSRRPLYRGWPAALWRLSPCRSATDRWPRYEHRHPLHARHHVERSLRHHFDRLRLGQQMALFGGMRRRPRW